MNGGNEPGRGRVSREPCPGHLDFISLRAEQSRPQAEGGMKMAVHRRVSGEACAFPPPLRGRIKRLF